MTVCEVINGMLIGISGPHACQILQLSLQSEIKSPARTAISKRLGHVESFSGHSKVTSSPSYSLLRFQTAGQ
ncbi:hypothetical protein CY34DRAFT_234519 [Suillus luteus UH-Slu-Lm8-n1]|uniref:Uncharacterized protein n=1 Tax=Suillus luteus UH-Slu-Lm8-n1 TaxID=930992 RepID=A0A0D0BC81_9AGAM|nr:hypothetical protein CY34DRAFT_234519 [Suillus luteus UH-Slu-Lm8-n1]